jgi:tetratricopeptide (TPR) repeat protein
VLDHLQRDGSLDNTVRREALDAANRFVQDPEALNTASWLVVAKPGAKSKAYDRALLQAEEACRLAPNDGTFLNTRGVAEYRAGHYERALATLTRSEKLNMRPIDLRPMIVAVIGFEAAPETFLAASSIALTGERALRYLAADPGDLAFLAMTHHQLGHQEEAMLAVAQLRETMKQPRWATAEESQALLREAELLMKQQALKSRH